MGGEFFALDPVLNSAVDPVRVIFHLNAFKSFLHFNLAASAARLTIINFFLVNGKCLHYCEFKNLAISRIYDKSVLSRVRFLIAFFFCS